MTLPPALRVANRDLVLYRRIWRENIIGAFVQPVLYLLGWDSALGRWSTTGAPPPRFSATPPTSPSTPGALATTAMFNAGQEALWPTADGFQWSNAYRAVMATPLTPRDLAGGFAARFAGRTLITAIGVGAVLALFDETRTWGIVAAIPVAVVCGLAFAMPIAAWTASRVGDSSFPAIMRFVLTPMFLFGGAFYPIEQLPIAGQAIAWATPLWHAIELCRALILGGLDVSAFGHLGVLFAYAVGGYVACARVLEWRLRQ